MVNDKSPIIDHPDLGELYVNTIVNSTFDGGTIGVTLGCTRVVPRRLGSAPSGPPEVHIVGRLNLTTSAAAELSKYLGELLAAIQRETKTH